MKRREEIQIKCNSKYNQRIVCNSPSFFSQIFLKIWSIGQVIACWLLDWRIDWKIDIITYLWPQKEQFESCWRCQQALVCLHNIDHLCRVCSSVVSSALYIYITRRIQFKIISSLEHHGNFCCDRSYLSSWPVLAHKRTQARSPNDINCLTRQLIPCVYVHSRKSKVQ